MTQAQVEIVSRVLRDRFEAEVETEQVSERGRYRFAVISPRFEGMPHHMRQDVVWAAVDEVLDRQTSLDISLILVFAPSELMRSAS